MNSIFHVDISRDSSNFIVQIISNLGSETVYGTYLLKYVAKQFKIYSDKCVSYELYHD